MVSQYLKKGALITAAYALTSAVMRCINFFFLPYFLTIISLHDFGIWDFYQLLFVRCAIIVTSLATHALMRFYFLYKDDPIKQHQVLSNAVWLLAGSLLIALGSGIGGLLYFPQTTSYPFLTVLITCLYSLFSFIITFIRMHEQLSWYMILFCGQNILFCAGTTLALTYGYGVCAFFYATLGSLFMVVPLFAWMLVTYRHCSLSLLKEQLRYSTPLLFYGIINVSFFIIDRTYIKWFLHDDTGGIYAIAWRFGSIFQIAALSLADAWPNIIFKAQQERDNELLIRRLIYYYGAFLLFASLATLACSHALFYCFMPWEHQHLIIYLPFFFISLTIYEITRLCQTGMTLAKKTIPIPLIGLLCIVLQCGILYMGLFTTKKFDMWDIIMCNTIVFCVYAALCATASAWVYLQATKEWLFDRKQFFSLFKPFAFLYVTMYAIIEKDYHWFYSLLVAAVWPLYIFISHLNSNEKEKIITMLFGADDHAPAPTNLGKHTYSEDLSHSTVILVGPYPPPLGGVSIHLERVRIKLEAQNNRVIIFDVNARQKIGLIYLWYLLLLLWKEKPAVVHLHTPYNGIEEFFVVLLAKACRSFHLVFIDHNCRYLYQKKWFYKLIYNFIMRCVNRHVLIGSVYYMYKDNSVRLGNNPTIESPFLPPPLAQKEQILATYPPEFFSFSATHFPLLCANASGLVLINSQDLYGFDTCIKLIAKLKQEYPTIGIILALAAIKHEPYYAYLHKMIKEHGVASHIFFLLGQKELWPALSYINLFIRPTLSDGLSLSIEEAQWAGKAVVASDASMRQPGTIIYKTHDFEDLYIKIHKQLVLISDSTSNENKWAPSLDHREEKTIQ